MARPSVLLFHGFPPETTGTPKGLRTHVESALPDIDLVMTTDYADAAGRISSAEIVIEHGMPDDLLERADALEWLQSLSAGVDSYDLESLRERNVVMTNISGVHADPIAEHVLACMLYFERRLDRAVRQQSRAKWRRFPAGELGGKTLCVVGVGALGGRIAELAAAVGMRVVGVKRDTSTYNDAVDEVFGADDLHSALGQSEYVVLACPLTDDTEGLITSHEIASMAEDAVLINVARGPVVDHDDLVVELQEGYLGGAVLDVTDPEPLPGDSPLWDMENVLITPHMAGGSPHFPRRCADIFVENYERYVEGDPEAMCNRVL